MSKQILLVDDDLDYLLSTQTLLQSAGYEVTTAEGAAEARSKLDDWRPDAAVIDLMMEEVDGGFSLCHHIKGLDESIPVIMATAVASETGLNFGGSGDRSWIKADAMLAKPLRFEQLRSELSRLLKE